jgi:uncharacterized protein YciI
MLRPSRPDLHETVTEAEGRVFAQHCEYLERQFREKKVLQAGTSFERNEDGFAIVILSAKDKADAIATIQADPAVAQGLLRAHVTEYRIFLDRGAS